MSDTRSIRLSTRERRKLQDACRKSTDPGWRTRATIILHTDGGRSDSWIAAALRCSRRLVSTVRKRWREEGVAGLLDRREDNGDRKATEEYGHALVEVLEGSPTDFGYRRPTWTQRLLIEVLATRTGVRVSVSTMSRLLARLRIRRGRPKPLAPCPWSESDRKRRVRTLHRLIASLPPDEVAAWEDEADVDLNPRIGPDWMLPGTQRTVMTPGRNAKRYVAAALDASTGSLTWLSGKRKDSGLFIALLKKLLARHPSARRIHVLLDNYAIHSSRRTRAWLAERGERIRLHFLPPYCPDDNRIERSVFREMHANVTNNHRHATIEELRFAVETHFRNRNRAARRAAA